MLVSISGTVTSTSEYASKKNGKVYVNVFLAQPGQRNTAQVSFEKGSFPAPVEGSFVQYDCRLFTGKSQAGHAYSTLTAVSTSDHAPLTV